MDAGFRASLLVCGLSQAQADALAQEGYLTYQDFSLSRYEDISDMTKRVQALSVARGGVRFGQMHIVKLKAFLFWLKDRQRRDQELDPGVGGFGQAELTQAIINYQTELETKAAEATKARIPEKFSPHSLRGWNTFNRELEAYLSNVRGITGVPLLYVIRKDVDPVAPLPADPKQALIAQAPLRGAAYMAD